MLHHARVVVDGSFASLGILPEPIALTVEQGRVTSLKGGPADSLRQRLDRVGPAAYNLAEVGIGLNEKAILSGNVLEDEKVAGTVHIALGDNSTFGGHVSAPLHLDGTITNPHVWIGNKQVIAGGKFLSADA